MHLVVIYIQLIIDEVKEVRDSGVRMDLGTIPMGRWHDLENKSSKTWGGGEMGEGGLDEKYPESP